MTYLACLQVHLDGYRIDCGKSRWLWLFFPVLVLFVAFLAWVDWLVERKRYKI